MEITYKPDLTQINEDDQTVYFTITDDLGNSFEWHADVPLNVDIQGYLDGKKRKILTLIYKQRYPDVAIVPAEGQTELDAYIAYASTELPETNAVPEPKAWTGTHPTETRIIDGKKLSDETLAELNAATTVEGLRDIIITILCGSSAE